MKIKIKKQLNLPQLIEWAWDNGVTGTMFSDNRVDAKRIRFEAGTIISIHGYMHKGDTFTVTIEKEITEDTKLDLIERFIGGMGYACYTSHGAITIKECLRRSPEECTTTHYYIENDDLTMTLIWRDGKLVE